MCGIAGYIRLASTNSETPTVGISDFQLRMATTLLALEMQKRGTHSWGMMYAYAGMAEPLVFRRAQAVRDSFVLPDGEMPHALALHTRHATTGKIKEGNAHPFVREGSAGRITGMHNGIIDNHAALGKKHARAYRVDSEHIFAQIAEGLPTTELEGYGAVVYAHAGEWFIARFNGGEMAAARAGDVLVFASTQDALEASLRLSGIAATAQTIKENKLYALTANGLEKRGKMLVSESVYGGRWDDRRDAKWWKNWEPRQGHHGTYYASVGKELVADARAESQARLLAASVPEPETEDLDAIEFESALGEECKLCGEPQPDGATMYWTERESLTLCAQCYQTNL